MMHWLKCLFGGCPPPPVSIKLSPLKGEVVDFWRFREARQKGYQG